MQRLAAAGEDIGKIAAMTGMRESDHHGPSKDPDIAVALRRLSERRGPDAGNLGPLSHRLDGSAYYCTFGLLLMVSGALVGRRRASGAWVYLAAFSLTLGWAFWEVGVDVW
jgi:hypothetical protein